MSIIPPITGKEKATYLQQLDHALTILIERLPIELPDYSPEVRAFGEQEKWDWTRLPKQDFTYQALARLVQRVQQEYRWFADIIDPAHPKNNRGYFEEITIARESGLPWTDDFFTLQNLRTNVKEKLAAMGNDIQDYHQLTELLTDDKTTPEQTSTRIQQLHRQALKRNFLRQLQTTPIFDAETDKENLELRVTKTAEIGGETLWNIQFLRYGKADSTFQAYNIDLWQDQLGEQHLKEKEGTGTISETLARTLKFGSKNAAWFILREIDQAFENVHPVHVSRALVGPFETRYSDPKKATYTPLAATLQLITQDPTYYALRFSRDYSYAPNHDDTAGSTQQIIYREPWSDQIIICKGQHAPTVANTLEGKKIRIIEG
ncbi:MAG: hypothetical protein Q7R96_06085 [Nanoarchaeota archaeon]|nr:hypothetical protein [Nanoarchaeota archaeon]